MHLSDLRGLARLATLATAGVTRIAEGVHQAVWSTLGFRGGPEPGRARGLTGLVYRSVHDLTLLVGDGVDGTLARLQLADALPPETPRRETILAILNGVLGDRLADDGNPLAISMTLRYQDEPLAPPVLPEALPEATGKIAVLIHGLCMSDGHWHADGDALDHGRALEALGYTPVYLRYNSGRHIAQNGRDLSVLLERLLADWPVAVDDLTVVAHSMGGLVTRSALRYAEQGALDWPTALKHIVFLGTPHHGSPLERAGNWVDRLLGRTLYTAPFAALGQMRSAGITDLRYGAMLGEVGPHRDRFRHGPDTRTALPLPDGVACYTIAATKAGFRDTLRNRLLGDGFGASAERPSASTPTRSTICRSRRRGAVGRLPDESPGDADQPRRDPSGRAVAVVVC